MPRRPPRPPGRVRSTVGGAWHDQLVTTVLQYLVVAAVIGLVVFGIAVFVFGRGEQLAPLSPRVSPTELPDTGMTPEDVRKVRFAMALRGYRMSDVDWALERMAGELERLRGQLAGLSGSGVDPVSDADAAQQSDPAEVLIGVSAPAGSSVDLRRSEVSESEISRSDSGSSDSSGEQR